MRVLQLCQRPQRRGAEVFAYQLGGALLRKGHEVLTAYLYPHEGEGLLALRSSDRVLGVGDSHHLETTIGFRPSLLTSVRRLLKEYRPDIIQVNGARSVKYGVLGNALIGGGAGAVVYRNIGSVGDWIRGPRRKLFYRAVFRGVDGVVAISEESRAALGGLVPTRTPVTVISNAVDPESLKPAMSRDEVRSLFETPGSIPVVIFVGSLGPEKRLDRIVDAVAGIRSEGQELHLWVVGDGPLRSDLEQRVREARLADVTRFFGTRDDVACLLGAADLLALASDTEGVPGVALEAGYLGLPVVATRVGGVPECVVHGETGLLVEPGDSGALMTALSRLAADPELRLRLGSAGRERVRDRHSIDHVADMFVDFYELVQKTRS